MVTNQRPLISLLIPSLSLSSIAETERGKKVVGIVGESRFSHAFFTELGLSGFRLHQNISDHPPRNSQPTKTCRVGYKPLLIATTPAVISAASEVPSSSSCLHRHPPLPRPS